MVWLAGLVTFIFEALTVKNGFQMKQSLLTRVTTLFLLCCLNAGVVLAQNTFQWLYGKPSYFNEYATHIINTTGGYMIVGGEAYLMKISSTGAILWQKTYDLPNPVDVFYHVVEANDGGFLAVGETNWIGEGAFILLVKTDANGNVQWQKRLGDHIWQTGQIGHHVLPVPGGYVFSGSSLAYFGNEDGIMVRIDNNGNIIWSQRYSNNSGNTRLVAQHVKGDTLFAVGYRDTIGIFALVNASTGDLMSIKSLNGPSLYGKVLDFMAPMSNGDFLLSGFVYTPIGNPRMQWICRVSSAGELKWSNTYPNVGAGPITPLSDGNFLLAPSGAQIYPASERDAALLKINSGGEVLWSYKYGKTGPNSDFFTSILEAPDGGLIGLGWFRTPGIPQTAGDIMIVKTDRNGRIEGCCRQPVTTMAVPYQAVVDTVTLNQMPYLDTMEVSTLQTGLKDLDVQGFCPVGPPEKAFKDVFLCPGDSVLINGIPHYNPGIVFDTLPGASCDTVVTYNIQYTDTGGASSIGIQCPPDKVVEVAPGAGSAMVQYDLPAAQSDCVCPGIDLLQTQGAPGGSTFAIGTHDICFQAQDDCGNSTACCFQISVVEEENACDVKTNGCAKFELLRITRDAEWRRTYHIRVTNNCTQSLAYAAFQVPDGVTAEAPGNNTTYTAPGGRQYMVRNPNFSPFYSIRFAAQGTDMKDSASDVFRYTLPQQSAPDYIHVMIKTGTQTYSAAHLNTFNCPIEFDPDAQRPSDERSAADASGEIRLFPNPAEGVLFADLKGLSGPTAGVSIFGAYGNLIFAQQTEISGQTLRIDLPAGMASGLYLFEAIDGAGQRRTKRFVVR